MLKKNVGSIDRLFRVVLGVALLIAFFMNPDAGYRWVYLIGIVPLLTGLMGSCGLYSVLGVSTCSLRK
jgi:hypothetical protein